MDQRTLRADRSKAALKTTFLELFRTKEPEEISVVELCQRAGVNRSTFYAHYEYMDKLIREALWENVAEVCEGFGVQWGLPVESGGAAEGCEGNGVQWGLPLEDCVMPREGIFVKILTEGRARAGDSIAILER